MRRSALLSAAAPLSLLLVACAGGGDESEADITADISQTLQGDAVGLDEETADRCAEIIVDEVGVEALKDLDLSAEVPPEELQEEIVAAAARGAEECDLPETRG
jgi:hypothetical protein